ncbi:MAG TPA: FadR/GntR family transcriptional regulator [Clostridia bacterium]|nr:FadR/GntR family transcriptional regulator [Clostridia bacterium]
MPDFLYNDISEQFEKKILSGSLKQGDKLPSERIMAQEYGVSRNVIRESLRLLSEKGLIETRSGKGVYVIFPNEKKIADSLERVLISNKSTLMDMLEVRETLELSIIQKAVVLAKPADIDTLKEICNRLDEEKNDLSKFVEDDSRFHIQIARCTNNSIYPILVSAFYKITDNQLFLFTKINPNTVDATQADHRRLTEAIENKDAGSAERIMKSHLDGIRTDLSALEQRSGISAGIEIEKTKLDD